MQRSCSDTSSWLIGAKKESPSMSHCWHAIAHTNEGKHVMGKQQLDFFHWILFMYVFFQWLMHTTKLVPKHSRWQFCIQSSSMPVLRHTRSLGMPQGIKRWSLAVIAAVTLPGLFQHIFERVWSCLPRKHSCCLFSMMGQDTKIGSDSLLQRQILSFKNCDKWMI